MKTMKLFCLFVLALCISSGVQAGSASSTLNVTTTAIAACSVTTSPVAFGDYDTVTAVNASGQINVTCSESASYFVALDQGANFTTTTRRMQNTAAAEYLEYSLWKEVTLTTEWGDSDQANTFPPGSSVSGTGTGVEQSLIVYGFLMNDQAVSIGDSYADIVTVTVHY